MSNMLNWVLHAFTGCPEKDVGHVRYGITHCHSCGRITFVSDCLPKIARFKQPKRRVKLSHI